MADHKTPPEPTMEEILTSIRRIIAEDEGKDDGEASPPPPRDMGAGDGGGDVLELTDVVPDAELPPRPRVVPPRPAADAPPGAQAAPPTAAAPRAAPIPPSPDFPSPGRAARGTAAVPPHIPAAAAMTPPDAAEGLISADAANASTQALVRLARASSGGEKRPSPGGDAGGGATLEQFVGELLTPLLREWLDRNLPEIVERVVEQEVKKLARRAELL